jgi:hypothetical protein
MSLPFPYLNAMICSSLVYSRKDTDFFFLFLFFLKKAIHAIFETSTIIVMKFSDKKKSKRCLELLKMICATKKITQRHQN